LSLSNKLFHDSPPIKQPEIRSARESRVTAAMIQENCVINHLTVGARIKPIKRQGEMLLPIPGKKGKDPVEKPTERSSARQKGAS
jgi:hypothetical protein